MKVVDPEQRVVFLDTDACPLMAETTAAETVRMHNDLLRFDQLRFRLLSGCKCRLPFYQFVLTCAGQQLRRSSGPGAYCRSAEGCRTAGSTHWRNLALPCPGVVSCRNSP